MNGSFISHEVHLSVVVLSQPSKMKRRLKQFPISNLPVVATTQRPDFSRLVIGINIFAAQFLQSGAAIDETAGNRSGFVVPELINRRRNRTRSARRQIRIVPMFTLHYRPPIVSSALRDDHAFPQVLADITYPEVARFPIETHSPRVAQSICPNFRPRSHYADEWIICRNGISVTEIVPVNIDTQDRSEQIAQILSCLQFIPNASAIAGRDIQIPVLPKLDASAIVPAGRPLNHQKLDP